MILDEDEYKLFLKTHLSLLYFAGLKGNLVSPNTSFEEFASLSSEKKFKCREYISKNSQLLDDFLQVNSESLNDDEKSIVNNFKKKISSNFIILKCLNKHAIFLKDDKVYAVKALGDSFYEFFNYFPVTITTTILPFKNKIIYDGFMQSPTINLHFGSNMRRGFNEQYQQAKKNKTIITSM